MLRRNCRAGIQLLFRNADALALAAGSSVHLPYELTNPYCFGPAVAPHLAAAEAGIRLSPDELVDWYGRATADAGFERLDANVATLERLLGATPLVISPPLAEPTANAAANYFSGTRLSNWTGATP